MNDKITITGPDASQPNDLNHIFNQSKSQFFIDLFRLIPFDDDAKTKVKSYFLKYMKDP